MRISSVPLAAVRSSTAKMADAAWLSASGVSAADARGDQQRGKQVAGAVRADRQFWRAHAPGLGLAAFDGQRLDLAFRRVGKLGAGDDDRRRAP